MHPKHCRHAESKEIEDVAGACDDGRTGLRLKQRNWNMQTFFHPAQLKHHPRSYLSRGQMRTPQEVPERALRLVEAVKKLGFDVQ